MSQFFELEEPVDAPSQKQDFPFLKDLNKEQREAVEQTEGPVLVLSGAGTGKTRVLTTRIAYLLATKRANPWQVLAVTFTNKASREMKERLEKMIGPAALSVWLGTFHSIGVKILARYPAEVGLKPNFIVLNTDDQERLVKKILQENGVDIKRYPPATLLDIIQRWKDRGLSPVAITTAEDSGFCEGRARGFYQLYQQKLRELNAVDFGDLLLLPLELFKTHPEILAQYQEKFQYLLVDEYQDTNIAQYLLLRLLAQKSRNICCVGDDDQSIYSWRGAEVENILSFPKMYPDAKVIRLEQNYRSTDAILGAASGLISHNNARLGKTLRVARGRESKEEKVHIKGYFNGRAEAEGVIEQVEIEERKGTPLSCMAVLVRTSAQTRPFEEKLIQAGIPYKIIGGFKFYEREEIRDAVAYLRLILNTSDDLAFQRIVNKPKRGIGEGALKELEETARTYHLSLFDAVPMAKLRPAVRKTLDAFETLIKDMREKLNVLEPKQLAQTVLENAGYIMMWQMDKSVEAEGRLENIKELYNVLADYENINQFIEYAALVTDADEKVSGDQLVVMTLHASKGLEFDCVFLAGWEEGLFPHQKALDEMAEEGLEEERRLAYVGLTRARLKAFISYANSRQIYGKFENTLPSRFIDELPIEYIQNDTEMIMEQNFYPNYQHAMWKTPENTYWPKKEIRMNVPSRRIGKRVYHETFGYGTVIRETPNGLEVHFDTGGNKKVQAQFLNQV